METNSLEKKLCAGTIIYEIIFGILAIISVAFAIIDIKSGLSSWQQYVDLSIWIIFVIDYVVRLVLSDNKKIFVKSNIFDLIAIIPFNSALRILRSFKFLRLLKVVKLMKIARFVAVLGRIYKKAKRFLNINGFKFVLLTSIILILIGGIAISILENRTFSDGIWWAFVTTTTVGYGDISPSTGFGRGIACILMITGIGLIGSLTSTITSYFMSIGSKKDDMVSNDKIDMVLKLYNELNETEKDQFDRLKNTNT